MTCLNCVLNCKLSSKATSLFQFIWNHIYWGRFALYLRYKYSVLQEKHKLVSERIFMRAKLFTGFFRQREREEETERDRQTDSSLENDSREEPNLDWSLSLKLAIVNKPCLSITTSSEIITLTIFKGPSRWALKVVSYSNPSVSLLKNQNNYSKKGNQILAQKRHIQLCA